MTLNQLKSYAVDVEYKTSMLYNYNFNSEKYYVFNH